MTDEKTVLGQVVIMPGDGVSVVAGAGPPAESMSWGGFSEALDEALRSVTPEALAESEVRWRVRMRIALHMRWFRQRYGVKARQVRLWARDEQARMRAEWADDPWVRRWM